MLYLFKRYKNNVEVFSNISTKDLKYIEKLYTQKKLNKLDVLGRGMYGCVYGYKNYAIKMMYETDGNRDVDIIKKLHHLGCFPKLYATINNDLIISERINGFTVDYYIENDIDIELNENLENQWDKALLDIIKLGYSPHDLHEDNVMICEKTSSFKIVDVGCFSRHYNKYDDNIALMKGDCGYISAQSMTGDALRFLIHNSKNKIA